MFKAILQKELRGFLTSPLFFILAGLFSLITGWIFFNLLVTFTQSTQIMPSSVSSHLVFINNVIIKFFGNANFILLLFAPIIGMGIFSTENENDSINVYFCSPVSQSQLVLGKYFALVIIGALIISTTMIFPFIMWGLDFSDYSFLLSGYLALFLNLCSYLAITIFMSSLTKNQSIACISSIVVILLFWLISWVIQISSDYFLVEFLKSLTMVTHFEKIIQAQLDLRSVAYYFSFIFFWIFLTKKNLERRLW